MVDLLAPNPTRRRIPPLALAIAIAACGDGDSPGVSETSLTSAETSSSSSGSSTDTTESTTAPLDSSTGPAPLVVDCDMPPMAAVGATYMHTPLATGGSGSALWEVTGLPPGLMVNQSDGTFYGTPEAEGSYDLELTATDGSMMASDTCTLDVGPAFAIDFSALGKPCIEPGDDISMFAMGGDGGALTCGTPGGTGNGARPSGITVNPDTCMIEGTIDDGYGTWVWITAVEQSGYRVYVPYCATQDVLPMGSYVVDGDHSGQTGNFLEPKIGTFAPGDPIAWGGGGDPVFRVTGPCAPSACYYGLAYTIGASPFDDTSTSPVALLHDMNGDPIGLTHELSATGAAVPADFEARPWVLSWNLQYCISDTAATCADAAAIQANGMGWLRFGTIMMPQ